MRLELRQSQEKAGSQAPQDWRLSEPQDQACGHVPSKKRSGTRGARTPQTQINSRISFLDPGVPVDLIEIPNDHRVVKHVHVLDYQHEHVEVRWGIESDVSCSCRDHDYA
jgi:hypothetical protein